MLDAAAQAIVAHGAGVSLDEIAALAGVSKGGLLHHYRYRDLLLLAVAEDQMTRFAEAVHAAVATDDHVQGRLVRGYVNATFDALCDDSTPHEYLALVLALSAVPGVRELIHEHKRSWEVSFAADGLDPEHALVITLVADGAAAAGLFERSYDIDQFERVRDRLLDLSRGDAPLVQR